MISLLQKIGLVLGATVAIAGSADGAKKTVAYYVNSLPADKPFTVTCQNEKDLGIKTKCNYKIKTYMRTGDKIVYQTDSMYGFVPTDMSFINVKNIAELYKKVSVNGKTDGKHPEKTPEEIARELTSKKKSPAEILEEACKKTPALCPNKPKAEEEQPEEPLNWNWSAYVGGDSEGIGFGELRFGIAKPKEKGTTFDFYLRGRSNDPIEKGKTLTKIISTNEELVGPGIYRIREDEEITRRDIQEGNVEGGIIWGYQINPQLTVFARAGALPVTEKEYTTLESTVAFEDKNGNPIGEPQTARQDLKPKEKTNLAATGQLGVGWKIPDTGVSFEASAGGVDGLGLRGELGINVDF